MKDDIVKIIQAGVMAPSADNLQPWKFKVDAHAIHIYAALTDVSDVIINQSMHSLCIGYGALIENIVISAKHFGYMATVSLFPDSEDALHIATVSLERFAEISEDILYAHIQDRVTNRNKYSSKPLTTEQKKSFENVPHELGIDAKILVVENQRTIHSLAKEVVTQVLMLLSHRLLQKEFYTSLRWTRKAVEETRDGLDVRTLELDPVKRTAFHLILSSWTVTKVMNFFRVEHLIAYIESFLYRTAGAYYAIVFSNDSRDDYVNAGRILERMWLIATREGLSVQPTEATLLIKKTLDDDEALYTREQKVRLTKSAEKIYDLYGVQKTEKLLFMFRVGTCKKTPHRSIRKEPDIAFE